jgi:hypothetical protein
MILEIEYNESIFTDELSEISLTEVTDTHGSNERLLRCGIYIYNDYFNPTNNQRCVKLFIDVDWVGEYMSVGEVYTQWKKQHWEYWYRYTHKCGISTQCQTTLYKEKRYQK